MADGIKKAIRLFISNKKEAINSTDNITCLNLLIKAQLLVEKLTPSTWDESITTIVFLRVCDATLRRHVQTMTFSHYLDRNAVVHQTLNRGNSSSNLVLPCQTLGEFIHPLLS